MRRAVALLFLLSCSGPDTDGKQEAEHRLAFGGDLILGRRLNLALFAPDAGASILAAITPLLRGADVALLNAEGVIAEGGTFTDKGEPRPHMYRAHPRMIEALVKAGVDVMTVGNNHSGDYGPEALSEMMDRLLLADMDYAGAGRDEADARRPVYRRVGDTVVAIVGADLTGTRPYAVGPHRPGSLCFDASRPREHDAIVTALTRILTEARRHAHVVILAPHWGGNRRERPTPETRRLAARLIRAGFDGILGHSAHWLQGVELIDGKPVVYDAGDSVNDYDAPGEAARAILYDVRFRRSGITELRAHPLWLRFNRTVLSTGDRATETLETLRRRSTELGTNAIVDGEVLKITCNPGGREGPEVVKDPPRRPRPAAVRRAPGELTVDSLPASAIRVNARWDNGITLLAYERAMQRLPMPKTGDVITLYWTTDRPQRESLSVALVAKGEGGAETTEHLPGDWLLPTDHWPVGKIVRDRSLLRISLPASGSVSFYAGLRGRAPLVPRSADVPLGEGGLVPLGSAPFERGAPRLFRVLGAEAPGLAAYDGD